MSAATRTGPLPARARDLDQEHPQSEQGTGTIGPARHSSRHHRGQSPGPKRDIRRIDPSCAGLTFADLSDAPLGPAYLGPAYLPGAQLLLDACAEPEVERIILLDAPAVLGWEASENPPTAREECAAIIDRILRSITPDAWLPDSAASAPGRLRSQAGHLPRPVQPRNDECAGRSSRSCRRRCLVGGAATCAAEGSAVESTPELAVLCRSAAANSPSTCSAYSAGSARAPGCRHPMRAYFR